MAPHNRRHRGFQVHRKSALPPLAIVGICLAAAILLTVAAGLLLGRLVDEETYRRLTEGKPEVDPLPTPEKAPARTINAYPYTLGEDLDGILAMPAASVLLNDPTGKLAYTSDVAIHLSLNQNSDVPLHDRLLELSAFVPYISGVFYPQALSAENTDLRHVRALEEGALLREFVRAGGSEILLCGLSVDDPAALYSYVRAVKAAVGSAPLGVALAPSTALSADNWELLAQLERICDFLVLDLRGETLDGASLEGDALYSAVSTRLQAYSYPITAYSMRLLIASDQTDWRLAFEEKMYPDFQIVK